VTHFLRPAAPILSCIQVPAFLASSHSSYAAVHLEAISASYTASTGVAWVSRCWLSLVGSGRSRRLVTASASSGGTSCRDHRPSSRNAPVARMELIDLSMYRNASSVSRRAVWASSVSCKLLPSPAISSSTTSKGCQLLAALLLQCTSLERTATASLATSASRAMASGGGVLLRGKSCSSSRAACSASGLSPSCDQASLPSTRRDRPITSASISRSSVSRRMSASSAAASATSGWASTSCTASAVASSSASGFQEAARAGSHFSSTSRSPITKRATPTRRRPSSAMRGKAASSSSAACSSAVRMPLCDHSCGEVLPMLGSASVPEACCASCLPASHVTRRCL